MQLPLSYRLAFIFIMSWIGGQISETSNSNNLIFSLLMTISFAYFFNAHGLLFNKIRKKMHA